MSDTDRAVESLILDFCPFPQITTDGNLIEGAFVPQPTVCQSCRNRACTVGYSSATVGQLTNCHRGAVFVPIQIGRARSVINGLTVAGHSVKVPRALKKEHSPVVVTTEQIARWTARMVQVLELLAAKQEEALKSSLGMFHDVQTSVSTIFRSAERLVASQPGANDDERIDRLEPAAQTLVRATDLLNARLKLMPLLTNPASAKYGTRRARRIYATIDYLTRVLRPVALTRRISFTLRGRSFNMPATYDSFDTIPLVLLENAIKYSQEGQAVEIEIEDVGRGAVSVAIDSFSPRLPESEASSIFERGFRGSAAARVAEQGSGFGLYLASVVAEAHGFRINHTCGTRTTVLNGIPYCQNIFSFTVG